VKQQEPLQRYRHDPSKNFVGFVVGDVEYAVAIASVREIANPLPLVSLPHAPRSVIGVADYRGEVVAVIDLRARFGLPAAGVTRKTKWIVVDVGALPPQEQPESGAAPRLAALVVDAVTEVFGRAGTRLRPAPSLGGGEDVRGIAGVTTHAEFDQGRAKKGAESGMVFVLDTSRLRDLANAVSADAEGLAPQPTEVLSLPPASTAT
jgi:purine-binding chemotaxis protein CheW